LVRLPAEIKVLDGSGTVYSDATYSYDQYNVAGLANCPGIIGHDNQNYAGGGARGNVFSISQYLNTSAAWVTTAFTYDIAGNLITESDANGHTTTLSYNDNYADGKGRDSYGFVTGVTNALGQAPYQANHDYGTGQPELTADLTLYYATYSYGGSGYSADRLTQVAHAYPSAIQSEDMYSYTSPTSIAMGQDQNTAGDQALQSQTVADGFGRPWQVNTYESSTQFIQTTQTYDALGRVAATTNPSRQAPADGLGYVTTYGYDSLSRPTSVTTPDGNVASTSYSGNTTTATDQAGKARTLVSDALGRVTDVYEDPAGSNFHTQYTVDPLGNVRTVKQINSTQGGTNQTRSYAFDTLGRLTSANNPESGTVSYTYDGVGNVLTRKDALAKVTTYTYDALNRPLTVSYSDGTPGATYGYDGVTNGAGHLTSVASGSLTTHYTAFDAKGRVTGSAQATAGQTYTFAYGYNLADALTSETYPSGRVVSSGYDVVSRPTTTSGTLNGQTTTYVQGAIYWPHGAVRQSGYGNNVWRDLGYFNTRLQPTGYWDTIGENPNAFLRDEYPNWVNAATQKNNGTLQSTRIYAGAPAVWSTLPNFTQTFGYDSVNRLISAAETTGSAQAWAQGYSYDQFGNMWMPSTSLPAPVTGPAAPTANVYNPANNQNANSKYDADGNLTAFGAVTLSYDAGNRQTAAGVNSYLYDGLGQRVEKVAVGATTVYVYDAFGQLAAEYSTAVTAAPCTTCYLSYDYLGSVRMVTDENANVVARHDFAPFGQEIPLGIGIRTAAPWGASDNVETKFTGQVRDTETNLDFFNARYLSGGLGRFMSVDPGNAGADVANPQSWNGYGYVLGNPLQLVDPSGMADCSDPKYGDQTIACVQSAPPSGVPVDTYAWWMNGGWLTVAGGQQVSSGGGGGGGGGTGGRGPAITTTLVRVQGPPAKNVAQKLACAADFGKKHSIASMLGLGDNYVANLFGGNSVSGLVNLGLSLTPGGAAPDFAKMVAGGASLGVPVNDALRLGGRQGIQGLTSLTGTVRSTALRSLFNAATSPATLTSIAAEGGEIALQGGITAGEYASGAALAKFAYDVGTFGYGYFFACGN
jgi:RHS repeat-associated protein